MQVGQPLDTLAAVAAALPHRPVDILDSLTDLVVPLDLIMCNPGHQEFLWQLRTELREAEQELWREPSARVREREVERLREFYVGLVGEHVGGEWYEWHTGNASFLDRLQSVRTNFRRTAHTL